LVIVDDIALALRKNNPPAPSGLAGGHNGLSDIQAPSPTSPRRMEKPHGLQPPAHRHRRPQPRAAKKLRARIFHAEQKPLIGNRAKKISRSDRLLDREGITTA